MLPTPLRTPPLQHLESRSDGHVGGPVWTRRELVEWWPLIPLFDALGELTTFDSGM